MSGISYMAINESNRSIQLQRIKQREQRQAEILERKNNQRIFIFNSVQRIIGVILIVFSVILSMSPVMYVEEIGCQDWTIAMLMIPLGLALIISRKCWMFGENNY